MAAAFSPRGSVTHGTTSLLRSFPRKASPMLFSVNRSLLSSLRGGVEAASRRPGFIVVGQTAKTLKTMRSRSGFSLARVVSALNLTDATFILVLRFLPEIFLRFIHNRIVNKTVRRQRPIDFETTPVFYPLSQFLCRLGQVGLLNYVLELLLIFFSGLGVPNLADKPKLLASCLYGYWAANLISMIKARLLDQALRKYRNRTKLEGRKVLYNRFLDAIIYLVATLFILDLNKIDVGKALTSLLTLCGASSIVVGLALKEPVTEIVQGTSILFSDKFSTGDTIRLSDGTEGRVEDMRWTDTSIRGSDNAFVRIPHSQIAKSRIVNFSRMSISQVSQKLTLPNRGTALITKLLKDIEREIRRSCPRLIDNGRQPFRVHWTDIEKDNIVISVEAHFAIARLSDKYWTNRQEVLKAISRAVEKYKV